MRISFKLVLSLFFLVCFNSQAFSQTWVDSLDIYARKYYLPAKNYLWTWQHAALLNTMVKQYEMHGCEADKESYLVYTKKAMDKTFPMANGKTPNAVASGLGLAFLYRITKDEKYKTKAEKVYADYLKIRRTKEGGVSHLMGFTELWDDTIFMIGEFLLGMYKATGDEKYLDELLKQIRIHREKLQDKSGLWVHGWDADDKGHCLFCSQYGWPDKETRKSVEAWGRGNGWIVLTLTDIAEVLPKEHKYRSEVVGYLKEMLQPLPNLQDSATGHWYQLPLRKGEEGNYLESSCTAMFAYGIQSALSMGIIQGEQYKQSVQRAYSGLRTYSMEPVKKRLLTTTNVCTGTCIGNKYYYFKRAKMKGRSYGIGTFILFGRKYEETKVLRKQ